MKADIFFLDHITQSIGRIELLIAKITESQFKQNIDMQDIVIRRLEIIGEAVKHISSQSKKEFPEMPWKEIAGTRDVLIHAYFNVDLDLVWKIIKRDLPKLKQVITELRKRYT